MSVKLDKRYEKLVKYLVTFEKDAAEFANKQTDPRPWMNFKSSELETEASEKKETELHKVLSRDTTNKDYVEARSKDDTKGNETAVPKLTGDFMAALERDKRAQWRGRIRTMTHAAAREAGNGQDNGPLRRHTLDFISRIFMKAEEKK